MIRTVVHYIDSAEFGGTEQALLHVLAGLDRRQWKPVLFHHGEPGITPLLKGAESLNVKLRQVPRMLGKRSLVTRLPRLVREVWTEHPAVFHAHLNNPLACKDGLIAAGLARVPAVIATAQLFVNLSSGHFASAQQRFVTAIVDRYIAVSRDVATRLGQNFHIPAGKIEVVHNGVPLAAFNRTAHSALRAALTRESPGQPIVLTTARLAAQKGHFYLLKAAALVPNAMFVLVGDGPDRARLQAQVRDLSLDKRVLFLGYRHDVADLLACCDVFVLPSLFEGLPLSILEAMAANKPVVASALGGNDEVIVHGETGLLVPPADPHALAATIQMVLSKPDLARRLAAAGKARVYERFSVETMVERVTQIYDQMLAWREETNRHQSHA
jgi:glycosyltransferase involved in cell wall biosynthesis